MPPSARQPLGGDDAAALVAGGILLALVVIVIGVRRRRLLLLQGRRQRPRSPPLQPLLVKSKSSTVASLSRPVGYGRRSGYAYAQVARSAHGAQPRGL